MVLEGSRQACVVRPRLYIDLNGVCLDAEHTRVSFHTIQLVPPINPSGYLTRNADAVISRIRRIWVRRGRRSRPPPGSFLVEKTLL